MGEIRIISPGKTRGYLYFICIFSKNVKSKLYYIENSKSIVQTV